MSSCSSVIPPVLSHAEIVKFGQSLPPAPRIMAQLSTMLTDIDIDVAEIARTVRMDPALTARVVRMSKTVMFGGGGDVSDIEEALARVGFSNVLGLVGAAGITQLGPAPLHLYGLPIDTFQRCSLCHAIAAENLARAVGEDRQAAYIAALLRGVGMVVLDRAVASVAAADDVFTFSGTESYADFERKLFGLTSVDITRILLEEWGFPNSIVSAVDLHHLETPDALGNRLACIVNVAGEIAASSGHGFPGDSRHWTSAPGKYEVLGVSFDFWRELCREANERFFAACQALKAS